MLDSAKAKQDAATKSVENAANAHLKNNTAITDGVSKLKGLVAAYVGFGAISKSVKLAIDAEQAAAQFEILTGSIEGSTEMLRELRTYSDVSPLSTAAVRDAARMMMSFNIATEDVIPNIKMLGDIAGIDEQRFTSLTLAFSQMSAAGRLMGQDVLQMVNAGFNPLQEISRKTGESMIELKNRMEDGGISAQEVRDAFTSATAEGGKFHGMTERLAETMGGKLAIAMGSIEKAGIAIGQALAPIVIDMTDGFEKGISNVQILVGMFETMSDGLRFVSAQLKDFVKSFEDLTDLISMNPAIFAKFSATAGLNSVVGGGRAGVDSNTGKLLEELQARDAKRQQDLEAEAMRRMNPATLDPTSEQYKARVASEKEAGQRAANASVGVLAAVISDAIDDRVFPGTSRDLLEPTKGEMLIRDAVKDAVEAIKDNKFSRIR